MKVFEYCQKTVGREHGYDPVVYGTPLDSGTGGLVQPILDAAAGGKRLRQILTDGATAEISAKFMRYTERLSRMRPFLQRSSSLVFVLLWSFIGAILGLASRRSVERSGWPLLDTRVARCMNLSSVGLITWRRVKKRCIRRIGTLRCVLFVR